VTTQRQEPVGERGARDRRAERRFRFRDRRTGFDRRVDYAILGTLRSSSWVLLGVLAATNLLSLLDGYLTYIEVTTGIASEGNPVLASLFEAHPLAAVAFKVLTIAIVSAIIWFTRRFKAVLAVSLFALAVFTAVVAYHIGSLAGFSLT